MSIYGNNAKIMGPISMTLNMVDLHQILSNYFDFDLVLFIFHFNERPKGDLWVLWQILIKLYIEYF
jgi:hypothetical protein